MYFELISYAFSTANLHKKNELCPLSTKNETRFERILSPLLEIITQAYLCVQAITHDLSFSSCNKLLKHHHRLAEKRDTGVTKEPLYEQAQKAETCKNLFCGDRTHGQCKNFIAASCNHKDTSCNHKDISCGFKDISCNHKISRERIRRKSLGRNRTTTTILRHRLAK